MFCMTLVVSDYDKRDDFFLCMFSFRWGATKIGRNLQKAKPTVLQMPCFLTFMDLFGKIHGTFWRIRPGVEDGLDTRPAEPSKRPASAVQPLSARTKRGRGNRKKVVSKAYRSCWDRFWRLKHACCSMPFTNCQAWRLVCPSCEWYRWGGSWVLGEQSAWLCRFYTVNGLRMP